MTARPPNNATAEDYCGPDGRRVQAMFSGIAHRYDFLNHFLSVSIDRRWRRTAVKRVRDLLGPSQPSLCLDSCSGTGDLAIALSSGLSCPVIASDFCHPMLKQAAGKTSGLPVRNVEADALSLPFRDRSFDAVTIAFGLRNLENPKQGLAEMARVLRPGGVVLILEFSKPVIPVMKQAFDFYFHRILPKVGAIVSGSGAAYQYLPASVRKFPGQQDLAEWLRAAGFVAVDYRNLSGGIAALHWGRK